VNILLSAGEVSGDMAGAAIAAELRRRDANVRLWGLGGARMAAAGVEVRTSTNQLGRVGVSESFSAILPLARVFSRVRAEVRRARPDAAILIANDVFNAVLGRWLRRHGVPVLAVYPPQVWIWRSLLRFFCPAYDTVAASFPEELDVYRRHVRTVFVGHPLADTLPRATDAERLAARDALHIPHDVPLIGLLPGSRTREIERFAPLLLDTLERLSITHPVTRFAMAYAEEAQGRELALAVAARNLTSKIDLVGNSHALMRASDLLLLASGTATLEAALIGTPMIAIYRVSGLTIGIVRTAIRLGLMDSETLALPNLLTGQSVIPEIRQEELSAERVAAEAAALLHDPARRAGMREELAAVRECVDGQGTVGCIADLVTALARPRAETASDRSLVLEGDSI
jgi:lipid-A-disaccharide synthase